MSLRWSNGFLDGWLKNPPRRTVCSARYQTSLQNQRTWSCCCNISPTSRTLVLLTINTVYAGICCRGCNLCADQGYPAHFCILTLLNSTLNNLFQTISISDSPNSVSKLLLYIWILKPNKIIHVGLPISMHCTLCVFFDPHVYIVLFPQTYILHWYISTIMQSNAESKSSLFKLAVTTAWLCIAE